MSDQNFWCYEEDFFGTGVITATQADNNRWAAVLTGSTPTVALVNPSSTGEVELTNTSTSEVQVATLYQKDVLQYDIDKIRTVKFRVKMNQAALTSGSVVAFGVIGSHNADIDAIAQSVLFQLTAATSTTLVYCASDDGTAETAPTSTGVTLINAYKDFEMSFANGTSDIKFFIDGQPVLAGTTFDMSNYTGSLQLFVQAQKVNGGNHDAITVDRISIEGIR
jgi:hypothetical protein